MSGLASLQKNFQRYVVDDSARGSFGKHIVGTDKADSTQRLGVYAYAYKARLTEILGNDFLGLQALVDAEQFQKLCSHYIDETPSQVTNARWYGDRLAAFLRTTAPWSETPALSEMADVDWTIGLSFDAPDETHVTEEKVAAVAIGEWPEMRFGLHASVYRLPLHWNVADIRRAVDRGETPPAQSALDAPQTWLFSRQDYTVRYRRLDDDEAAALDAAQNGAAFGEICEVMCDWHDVDVVAMRAAMLFKAWIQNEWIAELQLPHGVVR